jgi:hypothetical protein
MCNSLYIIGRLTQARVTACAPASSRSAVMAAQSNAHPLISKLESITDLTPEETQALADLPMHVESLRPIRPLCARGTVRPGAAL